MSCDVPTAIIKKIVLLYSMLSAVASCSLYPQQPEPRTMSKVHPEEAASLGMSLKRQDTGGGWKRLLNDDAADIQKEIQDALKVKDEKRIQTAVKMVLMIAVPLVALVAVTSLSLSAAIGNNRDSSAAIVEIQNMLESDSLVVSLMEERGVSASFLSSEGLNVGAQQLLAVIYSRTDRLLEQVSGRVILDNRDLYRFTQCVGFVG